VKRDSSSRIAGIVELKNDEPQNRAGWVEVFGGVIVCDAAWAKEALNRLRPDEATGEYLLTDLVRMALDEHSTDRVWPVDSVEGPAFATLGVNNREQLAEVNEIVWASVRQRLMHKGITLNGVHTIFVDEDVEIGPDTTLMPFTVITGETRVGANCIIGPHVHLNNVTIPDGSVVGPGLPMSSVDRYTTREVKDDNVTKEIRLLKVFLLHAPIDGEIVKHFRQRLLDLRVDVHVAQSDPQMPETDEMRFRRAMRGSDAVLFCLSGNSVADGQFVQDEIPLALTIAEELSKHPGSLIAVRIDDCPVPPILQKLPVEVSIHGFGGYNLLLNSLRSLAIDIGCFPIPAEVATGMHPEVSWPIHGNRQ
jgi:hypothetical protein